MIIILKRVYNKNSITVYATYNNEIIKSYSFQSKKDGSSLGFEIVSAALTAWAVSDLIRSSLIIIQFSLMPNSISYIKEYFKLYVNLYSKLFDNFSYTILVFKGIRASYSDTIELDNKNVLLGLSGGRDSLLSLCLLKQSNLFSRINTFYISYDGNNPKADFQIYDSIQDNYIVSNLTVEILSNEKGYYFLEPSDMCVTYLAPLFCIENYFPAFLALGLQWDNNYSFDFGSIVPSESIEGKELHNNYIQDFNLNFSFVFPINNIHSNAVFSALNKLFKPSFLDNLVSCWESDSYNCGICLKCQRVRNITKSILKRDLQKEIPLLENIDPIILYGSVNAGLALTQYPNIKWEKTVVLNSYHNSVQDVFLNILGEMNESDEILQSDLLFSSIPDIDNNSLFFSVSSAIELDYAKLSDEQVNSYNVPNLPFEDYFKSVRTNKILNCYGQWPILKDNSVEYYRVSDGPTLEIPDSKIFLDFVKNLSHILKS
ncbi:hypothetical protein CMU26_05780 [Elizabethkingia anophelis]|nr:hypothetical protein [Elizabethkingia anophelis]